MSFSTAKSLVFSDFYDTLKTGGISMPAIRKKTDLLNNLNEILEYCHTYKEPVYVTDDNQKEQAVMMSVEAYEELTGKLELYNSLQMGLDQVNNGEYIEEEAFMEFLDSLE
jgi:PHD/YefM family antitoxin component YafN of YafNO toxin-antitoxin module